MLASAAAPSIRTLRLSRPASLPAMEEDNIHFDHEEDEDEENEHEAGEHPIFADILRGDLDEVKRRLERWQRED